MKYIHRRLKIKVSILKLLVRLLSFDFPYRVALHIKQRIR